MKTFFKSIILLILGGLTGGFSYVVTILFALGSVQNYLITIPFYIFALSSLISAFILVLKDRANLKKWHVFILWLVYLSPVIFIFTLDFSMIQIRQFKKLNDDKKEVSLLMEKFHQQASSQGGYTAELHLRSPADWFSTFGYSSVCDGDWTNELHPSHEVSLIRRILGNGNRELTLNSVSCVGSKDSYALSVKFSDGSIKCIDKTGYFGPTSALNTGTVCLK